MPPNEDTEAQLQSAAREAPHAIPAFFYDLICRVTVGCAFLGAWYWPVLGGFIAGADKEGRAMFFAATLLAAWIVGITLEALGSSLHLLYNFCCDSVKKEHERGQNIKSPTPETPCLLKLQKALFVVFCCVRLNSFLVSAASRYEAQQKIKIPKEERPRLVKYVAEGVFFRSMALISFLALFLSTVQTWKNTSFPSYLARSELQDKPFLCLIALLIFTICWNAKRKEFNKDLGRLDRSSLSPSTTVQGSGHQAP